MLPKTKLTTDLLRWLDLSGQHSKDNKHKKRSQVSSLTQRRLLPVVLSLLFVLSALGGGILSCGGDTTTNPPPSADKTYWALSLNQNAVNMATVSPYNTIQLTATALNVNGTPLSGAGPVTYTAADSTVTVSPTGLVTAHYRTPSTVVTASLQVQNVTLTDQVIIQITDTVPQHPLATFSIQPAPGDSAKRALDFGLTSDKTFPWPVNATDAAGTALCGLTQCHLKISWKSSNPNVATAGPNNDIINGISPNNTGHVVFTATTWAYGVTMRDSVVFTIGYKTNYAIALTLTVLFGVLTLGFAAPKKLILGVGAVVTFCNQTTHPIDIIFDQPAAVDSASCKFVSVFDSIHAPPTGTGNIPAFGGVVDVNPVTGDSTPAQQDPANYACRRFPVPGTYRYHSSLFPSDTYQIQITPE